MKMTRREVLILLPAAAIAWDSVLAGTPESSPNYKMSEHWWGMLIDIPKCIGCGNCVRACQSENDVPDGYFRTWVERYHVADENMTSPEVISPNGGKEGFPTATEDRRQVLLHSETLQPLCGLSVHPGVSGGRNVRESGRGGADRSKVLPGLRLLRAGLPLWLPLHSSREESRGKVHAVLPPDHQGAHDRLLRGLPDGSAATGGLEEPERSDPRVSEDPQCTGVETADGNRRESLLQRAGWIGSLARPVERDPDKEYR